MSAPFKIIAFKIITFTIITFKIITSKIVTRGSRACADAEPAGKGPGQDLPDNSGYGQC